MQLGLLPRTTFLFEAFRTIAICTRMKFGKDIRTFGRATPRSSLLPTVRRPDRVVSRAAKNRLRSD